MVILRKLLPASAKNIVRQIIARTNAERFGVNYFVASVAREVEPSERVLDAGAGAREYKMLFSHVKYDSTDITGRFNRGGSHHTFISDLHNMPILDKSYDVIINTQVLEHVEYPHKVISEFARILKPNGKLFLTAPQSWGIHMAPYHFYNFTKYGLESLFRNARFEIEFIKPNGGIFWNISKIIAKLPRYLMRQYSSKDKIVTHILLFPFYMLLKPLCEFILPIFLFYVDRLDVDRGWTIGYLCYCKKRV